MLRTGSSRRAYSAGAAAKARRSSSHNGTRPLIPLLIAALCLAPAPGSAGITAIVSISSTGILGNANSLKPSISADGRFVAFESYATNLVPGDTNAMSDVFVRDRLLGATERVSVGSAEEQADADSSAPSISGDGRNVAFYSNAANLVASDTNGMGDVFVRDRLTETTERISVSTTGEQADSDCWQACISSDGRFVAFQSYASNVVEGDTNNWMDVFVRDRQTGITERVSLSSAAEQANSDCWQACISGDGRFVAFESQATTLVSQQTSPGIDVFLRDRDTGTTQLVSAPTAGQAGTGGGWVPSISGDGRFVAFESRAADLVPYDSNQTADIFVRDTIAGTTERVSVSTTGEQATAESFNPCISPNGRFVAFWSFASNLVAGDGNGAADVFTHDRVSGVTERVSISSSGQQGNQPPNYGGFQPSISADGRLIAFDCLANNLVSGDTNLQGDVFVRDRWPETLPPESEMMYGPCGLVISTDTATVCWAGSDNETLPQGLRYSWRLDLGPWTSFSAQTCANVTSLSAGAHTFEVKAKDVCENEDPTPAQCQFTVDLSGPSVSITSPTHGATVKGVVDVSANADHPSGIEKVEFYFDSQPLCQDLTAPYSCSWDTRPLSISEGPTQVCAKAYANDGKVAWACIMLNVDNATFDDVPKTLSQWAYVQALVRAAITSGCSAGPPLYCPYNSVTRAQMAVFLCRAAGKQPLASATPTFADVPKAHWAYGCIERLADAASWPSGAPTGGCRVVGTSKYFCPNDAVTREQMAKFLCLAASELQMPSCSATFDDVLSSNTFCRFIERLSDGASWPGGVPVTSGCACLSGYPPGAKCYCPKSPVTRGQMAVFLVRAFGIPL